MSKSVACIIARTVSTRLPLKVLRRLGEELSMLDYLIKRLKKTSVDEIYICTSFEPVDEILEDVAVRNGIKIFRGSPENVIERMLAVAEIEKADIVLRITGDNPLTSFEFIDEQIALLRKNSLDYVRVVDVPIGATAEVIRTEALIDCNSRMDPSVSEYLMLFLYEPENYRCGVIKPFTSDHSFLSITVDTPKDYARVNDIIHRSGKICEELMLKDILRTIKDFNIDAEIKPTGQIKLPYNKTMELTDFLNDMERRKRGALIVKDYE